MEDVELQFNNLVQLHKSTIYTVCYMFTDNQNEMEDLFQEVLVNMWKGYHSFRGDATVSTWVYRVAMNTCISMDRKKRRNHSDIFPTSVVPFDSTNDVKSAQVRHLHERICRLDVVDRAIVLLWLENLSYAEIGQIIGITPQNVGVKLLRIKEQLKKM